MLTFILRELSLALDEPMERLREKAAKKLGISAGELRGMKILRESLDARRGREPRFRYAVEASVGDILGAALLRRGWEPAPRSVREPLKPGSRPVRGRVVVIGFGPCGIFAALTLAKQGYRPLVLERGPSMAARERDFARLQEEGILNPEGNVCFGEGGAGAFSDGKLTARSKDPRVSDVMETLVAHGADPSIPYAARPHLGTENVRKIVCSIREEIIRLGGEVQFDAKCREIALENGEIASVIYEQRGTRCRVETNCVILAIGHSARDTYSMLLDRGIAMEQKPFAMGVRVEHPREFIDERQFGRWAGHPRLGAASYQLAAASGGRGVYSFCMCPGGEVVCSATEPGRTAVNGMSYHARDAKNSNSAIVAAVGTGDMESGPLGGIALQRRLEEAAYQMAGGYGAPVQRFSDFAAGRVSRGLKGSESSYRPYVVPGDLNACLPGTLAQAIREGFGDFDRKIPGFAEKGLLVGVETRTSSPVRILREADGSATGTQGLYPAGEGAGYAGGIVSAAVDGIRAAEAVIRRFGRKP